MGNVKIKAGNEFGRLLVLARGPNKREASGWFCVCKCGVFSFVSSGNLQSGHSQSCGCLISDATRIRRTAHGHTAGDSSPTYNSWRGMIQRCTNKSSKDWPRYGGAGISIYEKWFDFEEFLKDMGEKPVGTSIDRIDNKQGYSPDNCRWATATEQARNLRNQVYIELNGERRLLCEWSEMLGINKSTISLRLKKGLPSDQVLAPVRKVAEKAMSA